MILAAATVEVIERRFARAARWCVPRRGARRRAGCSTPTASPRATPPCALAPAWPWAAAYALMAAVFLLAPR